MTLSSTELGLWVAALGLGGVLLGGLVAGGFALLTGWLEGRREHRRWLRERRFTAYREALRFLDGVRKYWTVTPEKAADPTFLAGHEKTSEMLEYVMEDVWYLGPRKISVSLARAGYAAIDLLNDKSEQTETEFIRLRAQFMRDCQDQLRAGWPWQRLTQEDADVFKELKSERAEWQKKRSSTSAV